jgi:raffinose/stachyose/melibiose transport system permease protein
MTSNSIPATAMPDHPLHLKRRVELMTSYAFILPALVLFLFFELFSLLFNIYMGFNSWNGLGTPRFVGLENYIDLFADKFFWSSLFNNLIFMAVALGVMTVLGFFLAIVLDSGIPGADVFRALLFLPVIIPTVVVGLAWTRILSAQSGMLNHMLGVIGLTSWQQDWLGNPHFALGAVLVVWVWRHLGYGVVLFSTGLLNIPEDIKDAAALDGATAWTAIIHIIVPLLRPIILIVALWFAIFAFKVFTLVFIMTGGGPYNATRVLNIYMYDWVFKFYNLGMGSAVTNVIILILIVLSAVRSRFSVTYEY